MSEYYLKFHPYVDVVKFENGKIELANNFKGEALDMTPFIDKLIIENNKSYPEECMEIVKRIKEFYSLNSTKIWYLQKQLLDKELSLQSSML